MRDHDERLHTPIEQRLGLLQLFRIVALGGLDEDVCVELLGALEEEVAVALPAFLLLQRVHQEADFGSWFLRRLRGPGRRGTARDDDRRKHAEDDG